ncbi:MAG: hypothetical protein JWM64_1885, partial [Frankiales bacterium]|nr:hypothetical protein [Frankiales bacterium]
MQEHRHDEAAVARHGELRPEPEQLQAAPEVAVAEAGRLADAGRAGTGAGRPGLPPG